MIAAVALPQLPTRLGRDRVRRMAKRLGLRGPFTYEEADRILDALHCEPVREARPKPAPLREGRERDMEKKRSDDPDWHDRGFDWSD